MGNYPVLQIPDASLRGEDSHHYLSVRMPNDMFKKLEALAGKTDLSRNRLILTILEFGLDHIEIVHSE